MPKIPGIPHLRAVKALEKAGFLVARQGKHIVMTDGARILTIPRHDPVDAHTMGESSATPDSRPGRSAICFERLWASVRLEFLPPRSARGTTSEGWVRKNGKMFLAMERNGNSLGYPSSEAPEIQSRRTNRRSTTARNNIVCGWAAWGLTIRRAGAVVFLRRGRRADVPRRGEGQARQRGARHGTGGHRRGGVGTACPFCQTMFRDALGTLSQTPPKLLDIAQIAASVESAAGRGMV